jgi:tRNA U34 5-methylaminomethyl-2-thiouridine-forming methyltransferase MnmC
MPLPDLDWREGDIPVSRRFGDAYFSRDGGLEESCHVFLDGNGLPARFRDGFRIAELGFGTGLNLLAAQAAWIAAGAPGRLCFTSFEAFPLSPADMARALAAFPAIAGLAGPLLAALSAGPGPWDLPGGVSLHLVTGDARRTLPAWEGTADAWFLDGFAPARNPELWEPALLQAVADRMAPGATLATYTAAGHVRRALAAAGLEVARRQGFGRKRHMTVARKP